MVDADVLWAAIPDALARTPCATPRKRRLFCVACCWQAISVNPHPFIHESLTVAERYADGWEGRASLAAARRQTRGAYDPLTTPLAMGCLARATEAACEPGTQFHPPTVFDFLAGILRGASRQEIEAVTDIQRALLQDIFGNSFRPVAFAPEWRTDTAVTLARQMYESREFGAMPILADALQDAGCDSDEALRHCREPGPHVRGCWVCDLVLGKE